METQRSRRGAPDGSAELTDWRTGRPAKGTRDTQRPGIGQRATAKLPTAQQQ